MEYLVEFLDKVDLDTLEPLEYQDMDFLAGKADLVLDTVETIRMADMTDLVDLNLGKVVPWLGMAALELDKADSNQDKVDRNLGKADLNLDKAGLDWDKVGLRMVEDKVGLQESLDLVQDKVELQDMLDRLVDKLVHPKDKAEMVVMGKVVPQELEGME